LIRSCGGVSPEKIKIREWQKRDIRTPAHLVPLPTQAVEILRELLPLTGPTGPIFRSMSKRSETSRYMSDNTLNSALRTLGYDTREQITGHGFPESHAASFALLVYASCWIKCHHPAEFLAAMLNSQPLGFYSPSQLVQDAKRHQVEVRPVDVMCSDVDCTLEDLPHPPAVRLGLRMIDKLKAESADRIVAARTDAPFESAEDLARRAGLEQHEMKLVAAADALMSLSGHRRQQVWDAAALRSVPELLRDAPVDEDYLELPAAPEGEEIVWDYASLGLTLRRHPLALLRPILSARGMQTAEALRDLPNGRHVQYCGIVTLRQQPDTANGTIFVSLEDETGVVQVICWKSLRERQRNKLLRSRLLAVNGVWQREGEVRNLIAGHLEDLTPLLGRLAESAQSRDFK
jgi:error-prone DNA polymerase